MQNIIFTQIPIDELKNVISETVREEIQKLNTSQPQQQESEHITRKETARILGISLVTLHDWTKRGIIPGYRIGTRIRYQKSEILKALEQVHTLKYRRD